jgi:hypothetical protein
MWPKIAQFFELDVAPPLPMSLSTIMDDKESLWTELVADHGLADHSYQDVSSWGFADAVFSWNYDFFADGSKARRFGFYEHVDTEAMFMAVFQDLRSRKIIP